MSDDGRVETVRTQLRYLLDRYSAVEAVALRDALVDGAVDGDTYWSEIHKCGCVIGTLVHADQRALGTPRSEAVQVAWEGGTRVRLGLWRSGRCTLHPVMFRITRRLRARVRFGLLCWCLGSMSG
jgi:hypothetical protein